MFAAGCGNSEQTPVPEDIGPATFVGSNSCQNCHETEFHDWMGSHHELAMQIADVDTVLGNFDIAMALATMLRDSGDQDDALDIAYTLARRHPEDQNVVALLRLLDAIP